MTFADLDIAPDSGQRALHATSNSGTLTTTSGTIATTHRHPVEIAGTSTASRTPLNVTLTSVSSTARPTASSSPTPTAARVALPRHRPTDGRADGLDITNRGASFASADGIIHNDIAGDATSARRRRRPDERLGRRRWPPAAATTGCNGAASTPTGWSGLTLTNVDLTTGAQRA